MNFRVRVAWIHIGALLASLAVFAPHVAASPPITIGGQILTGDGSMAAWSGSTIGSLLANETSTAADLTVLGIRSDLNSCPSGSPGAIQILRHDGTRWLPEQRIPHPDPIDASPALRPGISCFGEFGMSVSTDGVRIAVAARGVTGDNPNISAGGAVYLYERNSSGIWLPAARVRLPAGQQVEAVALQANRLMISASTSSSPRIYAFQEVAGAWQPDGDFSGFTPMAVYGDEVLYTSTIGGATAQFIARRTASGWISNGFFNSASRMGNFKVLLDGTTATIASRLSRPSGTTDVVELYRRVADTWTREAELTDPDAPGTLSRFGSSVSRDGDDLVVGASAVVGGGQPPGAAYVFARQADGVWALRTRIRPADPDREQGFGYHVAIGDGVVGAHVHQYNQGWGAWLSYSAATGTETGALNRPAEGHAFGLGNSMAMEGDLAAGLTIEPVVVAGADISNNYGAIRVFRRTAAGWSAEARLTSPGTAVGSQMGLTPLLRGPVAIHNGSIYAVGHTVALPSRNVLLRFDRTGTGWSMSGQIPVPNSSQPSISDVDFAGDVMVLSTTSGFGPGRVDLYRQTDGAWTRTQSGPQVFNTAYAALNRAGDRLAVASRDSSSVQIWRRTGATFAFLNTVNTPFPLAVVPRPVFADDNSLAVANGHGSGCPDGSCSGLVALFATTGPDATAWQSAVPFGGAAGNHEYGVGVAAMGNAFLVSRQDPSGRGSVDIIEQGAGGWSVTGNLASPTAEVFDYFGQAMASDSNRLLIAAGGTDSPSGRDAGTIYAFQTVTSTPPPAPTIVTVLPGNHSATITWLKPASDGGSPITGYTVTATPGGQTCSTDHADALTCTITGLTNGVSYTFTVTARNAVGTSPPATTPPEQPVVIGTPPAPVVVLPPEPQPDDGTRVTLHWLAAESDLPIIGYQATAQPGGHSCTTTGALSCTITGLTPGVDYSFTVVAINDVGSSNPSPPMQLPPAITEISPDHGPLTGGTAVTITGSRLTATTSVTFGTTAASFTVVSDTALTATAPPGTVGTVDISVTTPAGTSQPTLGDRYTYDPVADIEISTQPSVTSVALGDAYTETLILTNHGPSPALQPAVGMALTGSTAVIVAVTTSNGSCTLTPTTLTCQPGSLTGGASTTVVATIEPAATGTLTLTAYGHADETDPATANNTNFHAIEVTNAHGCTHIGGAGTDTMTGTDGNDVICAFTGDDQINGAGGDDIIYGGSGNDTLDGGNGNDLIFAGPTGSIIIGGNGNDTINGGIGNDTIYGNNGNDIINAGEGNDTISGGNGNDTINAGGGIDTTDGGNGNDTCSQTESATSCST